MRYERKFTASQEHAEFALAWLKHGCISDPVYPSAWVSSIYYDTPQLALYHEKANGDYLKTKVRLRWYDPSHEIGSGQIPVFLEVKVKVGHGGYKVRKQLSFSQAWPDQVALEDDELTRMVYEESQELGQKIPTNLFPVLTVVYRRDRFVCPFSGARVCLDTSIQSTQVNRHIVPHDGGVELETVVLEIKDSRRAEVPWLEDLYFAGFRSRSFSKYAMCMGSLIHGASS